MPGSGKPRCGKALPSRWPKAVRRHIPLYVSSSLLFTSKPGCSTFETLRGAEIDFRTLVGLSCLLIGNERRVVGSSCPTSPAKSGKKGSGNWFTSRRITRDHRSRFNGRPYRLRVVAQTFCGLVLSGGCHTLPAPLSSIQFCPPTIAPGVPKAG